jgi:hypothetical protein
MPGKDEAAYHSTIYTMSVEAGSSDADPVVPGPAYREKSLEKGGILGHNERGKRY